MIKFISNSYIFSGYVTYYFVASVTVGKSEGKGEEPVDWSFAVLELLREQGWDVKEMNER